jgi:pimeloyl-ACP methyl ester carboxylesterase
MERQRSGSSSAMTLLALYAAVASGCATTPRFESLPEKPIRPHSFWELPRRRIAVTVPGRGVPLHVSYVEAGSGPPLVLVHGLMTNAYSFRYVIPELAKHYRVLVPELPGAGRSDPGEDVSMTPSHVAAVLAAFQEAVGAERAYVVGNSMGGYITLWLWLEHPEKVERLVVMHSPGFPEPRLYAMNAVAALPSAPRLLRTVTRNPEQFVVNNVHYRDGSIMSQEEAIEYGRIFRSPQRRRAFLRVLKETLDPRQMERLHETLRARVPGQDGRGPVLLLWATQDVLVPPDYGPRYQTLIPDASLEWIDGASHFLHVDAPEETVKTLLRFGREGR